MTEGDYKEGLKDGFDLAWLLKNAFSRPTCARTAICCYPAEKGPAARCIFCGKPRHEETK